MRTGLDFLRGVVLGYEVSTRIGVAMGRAHYKHWHNTGTMGSFGAAAATGSLLGLDEAAFANALAIAGTFTAGLQQAFRSEAMAKPLHAGRAAEAGLLAAQLAARGVRSSLDILEGEAGLGRAMSTGADWSQVGATLGRDFHITRLTFKNHIGCGHTFSAVDGALELGGNTGSRTKTSIAFIWACTKRRLISRRTSSRRTPTRHASACITWWLLRSCTAACGCRRSPPRDLTTRPRGR